MASRRFKKNLEEFGVKYTPWDAYLDWFERIGSVTCVIAYVIAIFGHIDKYGWYLGIPSGLFYGLFYAILAALLIAGTWPLWFFGGICFVIYYLLASI